MQNIETDGDRDDWTWGHRWWFPAIAGSLRNSGFSHGFSHWKLGWIFKSYVYRVITRGDHFSGFSGWTWQFHKYSQMGLKPTFSLGFHAIIVGIRDTFAMEVTGIGWCDPLEPQKIARHFQRDPLSGAKSLGLRDFFVLGIWWNGWLPCAQPFKTWHGTYSMGVMNITFHYWIWCFRQVPCEKMAFFDVILLNRRFRCASVTGGVAEPRFAQLIYTKSMSLP